MEPNELRAALEAILFVSTEPVGIDELAESFSDVTADDVTAQIEAIKKNLDENIGGFTLEQTAGGWRFATRAEHDSVLKKYFSKKGENRLSIAALETLAIIAYRQPVTAPEISDIRSVNSTGVIRTLLERRMIRVAGRKNVVGSPFLYRTTKEFLVHFGLNDIRDLPRLEEFGDLIGENMSDDLVAAIASAEPTNASEMQEIADGAERERAEAEALAELSMNERAATATATQSAAETTIEEGSDEGIRDAQAIDPSSSSIDGDDERSQNSTVDEVESSRGNHRE
jgi:segregation and condensation protein B